MSIDLFLAGHTIASLQHSDHNARIEIQSKALWPQRYHQTDTKLDEQ